MQSIVADSLGHTHILHDWLRLDTCRNIVSVANLKLYTDIVLNLNGYKLMYFTSRAVGQVDATRDYQAFCHRCDNDTTTWDHWDDDDERLSTCGMFYYISFATFFPTKCSVDIVFSFLLS